MTLRLTALTPESFEDFAAFHGLPECQGCFCMYWHFEGDNRAWQASLGDAQRERKRELVALGRAHGLLAYEGERVVGTVQFEPRDGTVKLLARMPYKGLAPEPRTWGLLCFRVLEESRRRGVARALLRGALEELRHTHGATVVEAYPRVGEDLHPAELWTGPASLYLEEGFEVSREHGMYPVLRRAL